MSRYIERAENIARFITVNWRLMLDLPANEVDTQWLPLVQITADTEEFFARYPEATRENVIQFLTFDKTYPNSVISCLRAARENAQTIREIIPNDVWEHVNTYYTSLKEAAKNPEEPPMDLFKGIIEQSYTFIGITLATMTHNEGWNFCRAGRMLERADKTSRILDVKYFYLLPGVEYVGSTVDNIQWSALLRSASALQAYRQRYGNIAPGNVVDFLLLNREFPRSVLYSVGRVQDALHCISGTPMGAYSNEAERLCGKLMSELSYSRVDEVMKGGLHEFLDGCQITLNGIGQAVHDTFFAIRPVEWTMTQRQ